MVSAVRISAAPEGVGRTPIIRFKPADRSRWVDVYARAIGRDAAQNALFAPGCAPIPN
jgi:hypothetical protein